MIEKSEYISNYVIQERVVTFPMQVENYEGLLFYEVVLPIEKHLMFSHREVVENC